MVWALRLGILGLALSREGTVLLRRVAFVSSVWVGMMTAISLAYFFIIPTTFLVWALGLFVAASLTLPRASAAGVP